MTYFLIVTFCKQFTRRYILFVILSLPFFCKKVSSQQDHKRNDEKTLRYLKETEWPKAYREQDTVLLDRILADEFKMNGSDGEYSTKKDQLEYIKTHKPDNILFRFEIK